MHVQTFKKNKVIQRYMEALALHTGAPTVHLEYNTNCILGAPVCIAKSSMYLQITLVFLTAFYMHLISLSVESYAIAS